MRRNLVLVLVLIIGVFLANNSLRKIISFRQAADSVKTEQERLEKLRTENESLKKELSFKKSDQFAEEEIRDKLGLAKEGEMVVILPNEGNDERPTTNDQRSNKPNWVKWRRVFFGS